MRCWNIFSSTVLLGKPQSPKKTVLIGFPVDGEGFFNTVGGGGGKKGKFKPNPPP